MKKKIKSNESNSEEQSGSLARVRVICRLPRSFFPDDKVKITIALDCETLLKKVSIMRCAHLGFLPAGLQNAMLHLFEKNEVRLCEMWR